MKPDLEEQFNARGLGSNELHTNRILDALAETQKKVDAIANRNPTVNDSAIALNEKYFVINEEELSIDTSLSDDP